MGMFSDLPSDVMLDIFTRLPAESIGDCKSVSKRWRNVLRHPSFNQMHSNLLLSNLDSSADSGKLNFSFRMDDLSEPFSRNLYYLEYDDEVSSHTVKKLKLKPPFELYSILGSCNGLVCINGLPKHYTSASYVAYICNPITGESITLPELDRATYYHNVFFMTCGFGYVAATNEYKVARLYTLWKDPKAAQIEVYTLGSGKGWRSVGKINNYLMDISMLNPFFGFIYWTLREGRIMAFDLANEIFVELDEYYNKNFRDTVLGGHYCGIHYSEDETFSWSMVTQEKRRRDI
ncbi:putative F-box protein At3g23960 [Papaver somniferum]|uniref:putative F-box protein At3g23960 n=1 Tax=Papaver somniferum TaxID=3469 RepID=UPI000E705D47|nr:putative F-box protein At3g23960 [Papaver somniferum]